MLAVEAIRIMEERKITSLVVVGRRTGVVEGVVHLHDLWRTRDDLMTHALPPRLDARARARSGCCCSTSTAC